MNVGEDVVQLTRDDMQWIAKRIFENECGGKIENLTWWNRSENFISLGLGHFIWYPRDTKKEFSESFPKFIAFLEERKTVMPEWLTDMTRNGMPWSCREHFMAEFDSELSRKLRSYLADTFDLQMEFIIQRAKDSIEQISSILPSADQNDIIEKYRLVASVERGFYPLIDYVNFKGSGSSSCERYNGKGWGLLQVLEEMRIPEKPGQVIAAFVAAAETVLERRVRNSPPERNEEQFLPGWKNRLKTYLSAK